MDDESIFTKNQPKEISEGLQNFIDSMVEEIVLEGKPFDTQKKYLKKFSENEGLDYNKLEANITTFIEILDSFKTAFSKLQVKLAEEKGNECFISKDTIEKLVNNSSPKTEEHSNGTPNHPDTDDSGTGLIENLKENNSENIIGSTNGDTHDSDDSEKFRIKLFVFIVLISLLFIGYYFYTEHNQDSNYYNYNDYIDSCAIDDSYNDDEEVIDEVEEVVADTMLYY